MYNYKSMAEEVLKRDNNHITVGGGVTDDANLEVRMLRVDPTTNRLKVSAVLPSGSGITELNGLTESVQTFSKVDDTNVTLTITSAVDDHEFALGWTGQTAVSRGGTALSTIASGSVLAANSLDTLSAITSTSGTKILTNTSGTITWETASGGGNVSNTGTPVDNQIAVWTDATTIEGTTGLTYNGSNLQLTGDIGSTGTRITKGWFTDLQVTNAIAGSITGNAATATALQTARTIGGVSFNGTANITVASATGGFTVSGGNLALGTNSITMSGSIGVTGTRVTKLWATNIESTNIPTVGGTSILTSLTAPQFTTIELGHATENTLSASSGILSIEGVAIPTISNTATLTNKRITPRVLSAASYTTDTGSSINSDTQDMFSVTAQTGALLFNDPSGTPTDGQKLIITVASSTTSARALTWGSGYLATTVALPTTTEANTNQLSIGFIWSAGKTKWLCVAVA